MFNDEEIIKAKNLWENQSKSNINTGVYIDGELYEFEEVELYNGKMKIMLPQSFREMPKKMKEIKYPSSDRPQLIKTNLLGTVNFTFNLLNIGCTVQQVPSITNHMKLIIKKMMPQYTLQNDYNGNTKNGVYSAFDYTCNTLDGKLYTMIFGASIDGKYLQMGFNCFLQEKDLWQSSAIQVCESIVDVVREVEKEV